MTCKQCGIQLKRGHLNSRWHPVARAARKLWALGVSDARIGRKFGFSRQYIQKRRKDWGK